MNTAPTKEERKHMDAVARLGCIVCRQPAQIHHCGTHMGGGRDHKRVIPLCVIHHTGGGHGVAIHAGKKTWQEKYGAEEELLAKVNVLLDVKV